MSDHHPNDVGSQVGEWTQIAGRHHTLILSVQRLQLLWRRRVALRG